MAVFISPLFAQSTNLDYPTPVSTDQVAGRIRARDIGDSRLTSHYYIFETGTGDVLLNIETANLNGDVDVYTAGSLKPLLKASVYAVGYATVMQRELYLRIPSRLILRIEGRTPNDDPGSYAIKFSGVFKPVAASSVPRNPGDPRVSGEQAAEGARARVSSVGTIIEEIKPPPPPEEPKKETKESAKERVAKNTPREKPKNPPASGSKPRSPAPERTVKAVKTVKTGDKADNTAKKDKKDTSAARDAGDSADSARVKIPPKTTSANKKPPVSKTPAGAKPKTGASPKNAPDPLAGVSLVIDMKDGTREEYEMTDVLRVSVDKAMVTIVLKNGDIRRISLLDIAEMKIGQ